jgi:hypothetical protein
MQVFQGEGLLTYRRVLVCLLLALGLLTLAGVEQDTHAQTSNSLRGSVTNETGANFPDVTITLSGSEARTQQTDSNGAFSFDNLATGGNYTVTPSKTGYSFTPTSFSVSNLNGIFSSTFSGIPTGGPTSTVQFTAGSASANETFHASTKVDMVVTRSGDLTGAATVNYATSNATASDRSDYLAAFGTLRFAAGENSKTISVLIIDDGYVEAPETFNVTLTGAVNSTIGSPAAVLVTINSDDSSATNPVKDPTFDNEFFVRQHYFDFLNRAPDASGLNFWVGQITECGANAGCIEVRRINVSAAFFLSIEFQETGYLVERLYKSAYGDADGLSTLGTSHQIKVPIVRLNEFLADSQQIAKDLVVGVPGWQQVLENNKVAFTQDFVTRSRFIAAHPTSKTPTQFVTDLNANTGNTLSAGELTAVIEEFGGASDTSNTTARARALRRVAENATLAEQEKNKAFVLMQYFGYLRRNPNDVDPDHTGYDFWLQKLISFNGNFVNAEMVKAFLDSTEYRARFGP